MVFSNELPMVFVNKPMPSSLPLFSKPAVP